MPLAAGSTIDDTTWAALALVLTIVGAVVRLGLLAQSRTGRRTARRRVGVAAGRRVAHRHPQADRRASSRTSSTGPRSWCSPPSSGSGIVVAGVAAALWVLSGVMRARGIGVREQDPSVRSAKKKEVSAGQADRQEGGRQEAGHAQRRRHRGPGRHRGDPEATRDLVSSATREQHCRTPPPRPSSQRRSRRGRVRVDPDGRGGPRRVRRQRRRPRTPRGRQARPAGLEVTADPGPDAARTRTPRLRGGARATRCARHSGWCARASPTTW